MSTPPVHALVLAAGQGTRMRSARPKVLHPVAGRPLIAHVVAAATALEPASLLVVGPADLGPLRQALAPFLEEPSGTADEGADADASALAEGTGTPREDPGNGAGEVRRGPGDGTGEPLRRPGAAPACGVRLVVQDPPAGTADAVRVGCDALEAGDGVVVVINGDCPGLLPGTLRGLVDDLGDAAATCLTVRPADATGYGRVVRDGAGDLARIVEAADASDEELALDEVNAGIYCFDLARLREALGRVDDDNAQGELYLTDVFALLSEAGHRVRAYLHDDADEVHGVNDRAELARAEALLQRRKRDALMEAGVTLRDPASTFVDADVEVGPDTVVYPGVTLEAGTVLGSRCTVHPHVRIARSRIGDGVTILDGSIVEDSRVDDGASIGPYGRLRPGSDIGKGAKVGNFVEIKKTRLGAGSKASHLTYLGDAEIGEGVNVGAGTITCNYDGAHKHRTVIDDGAFIGSNTALVAPVRIGKGAYVAAGSTITEDVPDGSLGLARGRQVVKEGWARQKAPRKE